MKIWGGYFSDFFPNTGVNKITRRANFFEPTGVNIFPHEIIRKN